MALETALRRRDFLTAISTGLSCAAAADLDSIFEAREGAAVVLDVSSGRVIAVHGNEMARRLAVPPGSTLKPFVLASLLAHGRLNAGEGILCPGKLTIAGRNFNCSHPPLGAPMRVATAIAYSCNYFTALVAKRTPPNVLAGELRLAGFDTLSAGADSQLLALGEDGIRTTTMELARAYRHLALRISRSEMQPILEGLEGAVEYGTAQRAAIVEAKVAGKTGSVVSPAGSHIAWFAGFTPSRAPRIAVTAMLAGHSGGADAAPIAGRIFSAYRS